MKPPGEGSVVAPPNPLLHRATRRPWLELAAVAFTLMLWVGSKGHSWHLPFVLADVAVWMVYCALRLGRGPALWMEWGLSGQNTWQASLLYGAFTATAVAAIALVAVLRPLPMPHIAPMAWVVYPAWSFAQEFAVQNVVVAALVDVGASRRWIPLFVGVAFAAGHAPVWTLAAVAFVGGVAWTWIWLRIPNLWVLAASHAVVGGAAIVLLLGENPTGGFYGVPLR